jgi:hypothetical protein
VFEWLPAEFECELLMGLDCVKLNELLWEIFGVVLCVDVAVDDPLGLLKVREAESLCETVAVVEIVLVALSEAECVVVIKDVLVIELERELVGTIVIEEVIKCEFVA